MDVERTERHMTKWLSENCADTNATVLQNVRLFMDHISTFTKTRSLCMRRATIWNAFRLALSTQTNVFSDMAMRLCKEYNDAQPNWQPTGGDVRSARFEHLPEKVAPCGRSARRHHGTKTGPDSGATAHTLDGGGDETCRDTWTSGNRFAFWQARIQFPQLPEFCDFADPEDE